MANSGFFLGGLAEGMETARKGALAEKTQADLTGIQSRQVGVQEAAEARAGNQQFLERGDKLYQDNLSNIAEAVKAGQAAGRPPETILKSVAPLVDSASQIAKVIGINPGDPAAKVQAWLAVPGAVEQAQVAGTAAGAGAISEAATKKEAIGRPASSFVRGGALPAGVPAPGVAPLPGAPTAPVAPVQKIDQGDTIKWKSPNEQLADADQLHKEFMDKSKDYITIRDYKQQMDAVTKGGALSPGMAAEIKSRLPANSPLTGSDNPQSVSDIALIFSFMKILDPPSVVRPGEYATVQNAGAVEDRIRSLYNKLLEGGQLGPQTRAEVIKRATEIYQARSLAHDKYSTQMATKAQKRGHDPNEVVPDLKPEEIFDSQDGVQKALKSGQIKFGDTIIFNGRRVKVEK